MTCSRMRTPRTRRAALFALWLAPAAVGVLATLPRGAATAAEKRYAPEGIGVGGYDPVAYFTDGKAVEGSEQFTTEHAGVSYRFASAAHREAFAAAPETYLPQYGGYCAYAAAKGALASTDPEAFTVKDGKLYLNYSQDVRKRWLPRAGEYIKAADENWPRLGAGAE
jgi:YHS domain-containing protein